MIATPRWVFGLGSAGAVCAAAHAYAFGVILGAVPDPDDIPAQLLVFASNQTLSFVWILTAIGMWAVLVSLLPAIWRALGPTKMAATATRRG